VREESQLDEMRDAIRGDFERLAERRGEQGLLRAAEPAAEGEPPAEPEVEVEVEPEGEVEVEVEVEVVPELEEAPEPESPRRSWLARLFAP
jgi:hypothetical protein